jgi:4-hydroxythreonine-4-phosphate dehydrogenase
VILSALPDLTDVADIVVVGDASVMSRTRGVLDSTIRIHPIDAVADARFQNGAIDILDLDNVTDLKYGVVKETYGQASLEYIERAIELAKEGTIDAITTAPINKQSTGLAGSEYNGHTGMLADYTDTESYSMMLVEEPLRVTHVSTHVPLREACDLVTTENVLDTIQVTEAALQSMGIEAPSIAVAGLNPHASDGGLLGSEDAEAIEPAVTQARAEGIEAFGPESPDTVYMAAAGGAADCVVSMYHDQGHIPIKMLGFEGGGDVSGVNVTIGLPFVRTSVDHGTAFDIAGQDVASPTSMIDAVKLAAELVLGRRD